MGMYLDSLIELIFWYLADDLTAGHHSDCSVLARGSTFDQEDEAGVPS